MSVPSKQRAYQAIFATNHNGRLFSLLNIMISAFTNPPIWRSV